MHRDPPSRRRLSFVALPFAAVALASFADLAVAAGACDERYSLVQRRVIAHAAVDRATLLRFVDRTKPVFQLDARETLRWLADERERRPDCVARVAAEERARAEGQASGG